MAITISGSGITSANIADGTIVNGDIHPSAAISGSKLTGAGKVLQVVQGTTDTETINTTTTYADTTLTATITRLSATSKILVIITQGIWLERSGGEAMQAWINLMRAGSQINQRFYEIEAGLNNEVDRALAVTHAEHFLDTPTTTSVTYKTQARVGPTSASPQVASQKGGTNYHSKITLMEIGA